MHDVERGWEEDLYYQLFADQKITTETLEWKRELKIAALRGVGFELK